MVSSAQLREHGVGEGARGNASHAGGAIGRVAAARAHVQNAAQLKPPCSPGPPPSGPAAREGWNIGGVPSRTGRGRGDVLPTPADQSFFACMRAVVVTHLMPVPFPVFTWAVCLQILGAQLRRCRPHLARSTWRSLCMHLMHAMELLFLDGETPELQAAGTSMRKGRAQIAAQAASADVAGASCCLLMRCPLM